MDTKLKNNHKSAILIIVVVLLICSVGMVLPYPIYGDEMKMELENRVNEDTLYELSDSLVEGCYILYNEVYEETDRAYVLQQYGGDEFDQMRRYMDYEVFDWDGKSLLGANSNQVLAQLNKGEDTPYAYRASFTFQEDGEMSDIQVNSNTLIQQVQNQIKQNLLRIQLDSNQWSGISSPTEVQIVFGITEDNLNAYIESSGYMGVYPQYVVLTQNEMFQGFLVGLGIVLALLALLLSMAPKFSITTWKVFAVPFEIVLCILGLVFASLGVPARAMWLTIDGGILWHINGIQGTVNDVLSVVICVLAWFVFFALLFWTFVCFCCIFTMKMQYWTERTLCAKAFGTVKSGDGDYGKKVKQSAGNMWSRLRDFCKAQYNMLLHLDIRDKTNATILKIIGINFVVLLVVCSMWFYGIAALIIYSIVLFLFLKRYFKDTQKKYGLLLQATNQLAEGNLDTPIAADMGIFNPIGEELKKIQNGFKKAVDEEVKSERMKTELITNVSHDLKTPLTAIITYTDLVKNETDEEKRKEYISVLEKKSLRLKVLIEDLFEISKATSKNVTMNYMKVDIIDLLKQVGLECDSKIKEANLEFRYQLPENKIILWLDSQKTYRIFENLLVNITKYAMPHTRVYIEMKELENQVYISMKNVSASELHFSTEEITDRFVRGDASRNTEGSGLGLAIAKSFTELQQGTLDISTDADLFKVDIRFSKRQMELVPESQLDYRREQ